MILENYNNEMLYIAHLTQDHINLP